MFYVILWLLLGLVSSILFFMHVNKLLGSPSLRIKDFVYIAPFSLVGPIMALVFLMFVATYNLGKKYNKFLNITIIK